MEFNTQKTVHINKTNARKLGMHRETCALRPNEIDFTENALMQHMHH